MFCIALLTAIICLISSSSTFAQAKGYLTKVESPRYTINDETYKAEQPLQLSGGTIAELPHLKIVDRVLKCTLAGRPSVDSKRFSDS